MPDPTPDPAWESATYDGARRVQLREQARLPIGLRLDWLDDAQQLIDQLQRNRRAERDRRAAGGEAERGSKRP